VIPKGFERIQSGVGVEGREKEVGTHASRAHQTNSVAWPGLCSRIRSAGLFSHLIKNEFLALNEACERLAGSEEAIQRRRAANAVWWRQEASPTPTVPSKACLLSSRSCGPPSSA